MKRTLYKNYTRELDRVPSLKYFFNIYLADSLYYTNLAYLKDICILLLWDAWTLTIFFFFSFIFLILYWFSFSFIFLLDDEEACDCDVTWKVTWCDIISLEHGGKI